MPWDLYTCQWPECNDKLPSKGFCKKHEKLKRKQYDKTRDPVSRRMYGSKRWKIARKWWLKKHPLCTRCGRPATVIDHIKPHRGDLKLFWDKDNWQSMCKPCHDYKTGKYEAFGRG